MRRIPVIDITDLYLPPQDAGDNFDLIMPYGLPEVDLRAVILDATEEFRQPDALLHRAWYEDHQGPRDPGFIAVAQLNYIFGRQVPCATGPFSLMRSSEDCMYGVPTFQQQGIELILETLRQSEERVTIMTQGSVRTLAAAYNRDPALLHAKVERIHLSAGASSPHYLEWNVNLDPHAFVCLLRSKLPIALYPCATEGGPFAYGSHNSFWALPDLRFIAGMHPQLRRYLGFAFAHLTRMDFLRAMDYDLPDDVMEQVYTTATKAFSKDGHLHHVWETALWANITNRHLVRRQDSTHRLLPQCEVCATDKVLPNILRPCTIEVCDDGMFTFAFTDEPTNFAMYDRGDAYENERAFREALPALYQSFVPESHEVDPLSWSPRI